MAVRNRPFASSAVDGEEQARLSLRRYGREELEIRTAEGELEVRITLTEAGPLIQLRGARLEFESPDAVPLYAYEGQRSKLIEWADHRSPEELEVYRATKNARSIDGLPAFDAAVEPAPG